MIHRNAAGQVMVWHGHRRRGNWMHPDLRALLASTIKDEENTTNG